MKRILIILLIVFAAFTVNAKVYHISKTGSDTNYGTEKSPFLTISKAARIALVNDTIMIHQGVYRERVSPENGGLSDSRRITYMAASGEDVWIKGSEIVTDWNQGKNGVWIVEVDNSTFGDFNPFAINISGDWLMNGKHLHLGMVYFNGTDLEELKNANEVADVENSWSAVVKDETTIITANFGKENPNKALTEINVRSTCFFPKTTGINYITVKGLKISQAATQWSAPTSEQVGIIGPNWSKGWIIEDCEVSYSRCVGICLGKERASGHNLWTLYRKDKGYMKCGFNREIEAIFKAYDLGWSKENIGSHLVQNNKIFECGQAGIVGHMGAAFSTIRHNEIYNINRTEGKLRGAECAGIKIHAAIDAHIENNIIVNTLMGIWLDWQAQGTHVVGNIIAESEEQDLFFEVTHGPTLVYNNILLSSLNILHRGGQGIAFFNNILSSNIKVGASPERYTPYHHPHSTKIKGLFNNTGGDCKYYNNVFLANGLKASGSKGLESYRYYPVYSDTVANYIRQTPEYLEFKFPIATGGNVYYKDGKPYKNEVDFISLDKDINMKLEKIDNAYYIVTSGNYKIADFKSAISYRVATDMLGYTMISEAEFENTDGTPFLLTKDFIGNERNSQSPVPGPFEVDFNFNNPIWNF